MAMGMQSAILKVMKRDEKPEAIIVEASGVANPGEVAKILGDEAMRPYASLELVISMLDCENISAYKPSELGLIKAQLRYSGIVMPTKIHQASSENIVQAMKFIRDSNPDAVIIEDYQKILNLDLLLGTKQTAHVVSNEDPLNINANELFRSWNYSTTEPMTEAAFQQVLNQLPPETVRGKGFLYLKEYPAVRFEFQMVGKSAQVQPKGGWVLQNPRTEIVFIALKS
jgi:G3E family GTPase